MEQEQFFYNLFMAQQEQRRAEKQAAKAKQTRDGNPRELEGFFRGLWTAGLWTIGGIVVLIVLLLSWR